MEKWRLLFLLLICGFTTVKPLTAKPFNKNKIFKVVGYYYGQTIAVDSFEIEKLTHLIFCFGHLHNNRFEIGSKIDSNTIRQMVKLKSRNPKMKVMLSLGGWSGCKTCSDVFNSEIGRKEFAQSVKEISIFFKTDGIDLDWEYPAIKGFPTHNYRKADKHNFTLLLKAIRKKMGKNFEISFAAGGFTTYIDSSIEWNEVKKQVDFINLMSYDLVHGYSKKSGHHTPLFSTPEQIESTDHAVKVLLQCGIPANKIIIGAAFYGRFFETENNYPVDLYQPAKFAHSFSYKNILDSIIKNGFEIKWDSIAQAPYAINLKCRLVATFDNEKSIELKTNYALKQHLGGIMFWQLYDDKLHNGMLNVIDKTLKNSR